MTNADKLLKYLVENKGRTTVPNLLHDYIEVVKWGSASTNKMFKDLSKLHIRGFVTYGEAFVFDNACIEVTLKGLWRYHYIMRNLKK